MVNKSSKMIVLLVLTSFIAFSQIHRPRNKAIVAFKPVITRTVGNEFIYFFTVSSSPSSEEVLDGFDLYVVDSRITNNEIDIQGPTNKKWYIDGSDLGFISGAPASRFLEIPPENGLAPGESMTFSFMSRGLPSIKPFYAQSFAPSYNEKELDSLYAAGYSRAQLFPDWKDNSYKDLTISPQIPDSPFVASAFLDTLLSYTRQSADLGWLGRERDDDCDDDERPEDGIVKNIEQRLQKAKRELAKRDTVQARIELEKLVQKVERIWKRSQEEEKKHGRNRREKRDHVIMTSEAYALLKYNAEYLIDRLPEKSKHGRGDDEKDKKPKK